MEHTQWFKHITRNDSLREVARRAGVNNRTLANQVSAGELKPEIVIKVAQGYDESPIIALIDLGFVSAKWMTTLGTRTALSRASDEELTDELLRRLHLLNDEPADVTANKRAAHLSSVDQEALKMSGHDDLIRRINSGEETIAAQEATPPLEESQP